ncbi:MAG: cell division/cell wall cluster transcriptional repressor MraZ [Tenericutes bacterium]|nr:MAG: cell division/cell wall cluster transcriptional repressor MraZ [Mycoplasmatota bacterium]
MFGNYSKSLDPKNRVIVPAKLRKELGNYFYLTVGPDRILEARDAKSFDVFQNSLTSNNMLNATARQFARLLLGNTEKVEVDKQGRIVLPKHLLESANITKDVV